MKRLALIFLAIFISFPVFADDCKDALEESTILLEQAIERIDELEAENARLKKGTEIGRLEAENERLIEENGILKDAVAESAEALSLSNDVLTAAYERIVKDSDEIIKLRNNIGNLIDAGVEIKTYDWNVMVLTGYPVSMEVLVAYNLPFFTSVGVVGGVGYNIDANIPSAKVGIKINIGKD